MICAFEVVLLIFVVMSSLGTFFYSLDSLNKVDSSCSSNSIYFLVLSVAIVSIGEVVSLATNFQISVYEEHQIAKNQFKTNKSTISHVFSLICWITRLAFIIASTVMIEAPPCVGSSIYTNDLHFFMICMWIFWSFSAVLMIPKLYVLYKFRLVLGTAHANKREYHSEKAVVVSDDEEELISSKN